MKKLEIPKDKFQEFISSTLFNIAPCIRSIANDLHEIKIMLSSEYSLSDEARKVQLENLHQALKTSQEYLFSQFSDKDNANTCTTDS